MAAGPGAAPGPGLQSFLPDRRSGWARRDNVGMLAGHVTALFRYRFAFTQDRLLTPAEFVREADDRGCEVTAAHLRRWHQTGWLRPLFFISDDAAPGLDVQVPPERTAGVNAVGDAVTAARDGRLRDGSDMPFDAAPHDPSRVDRVRSRWLYSEWQLLDLRHLRWQPAAEPMESAASTVARARVRTVALCHASWWALPAILDSVRLPDGPESYGPWTAAANAADLAALLDEAMWTVTELRDQAERLLLDAHHDDPNREWLALVRHMSPQWWRRLHGSARDAAERRIAAEILLAAYERLAMRGDAQPLPDLSGAMSWHPLHDRLTGTELDRTPLDQALEQAGLSPHPRAVLLVEGESEAIATRLLLTELASETSDWVRVHTLEEQSRTRRCSRGSLRHQRSQPRQRHQMTHGRSRGRQQRLWSTSTRRDDGTAPRRQPVSKSGLSKLWMRRSARKARRPPGKNWRHSSAWMSRRQAGLSTPTSPMTS